MTERLVDWFPVQEVVEFSGGWVMEPKVGIHKTVRVLDFSRMYPSVMLNCKISPDTVM